MSDNRLWLTHATLVDVSDGSIYPNMTIEVEVDRITAIRPSEDADTQVGNVIDLKDQFVLPGLIDCHVHVNAVSANLNNLRHQPASLITPQAMQLMENMLMRGFTTVRDAAGADWGIAKAVEDGFITSPRIIFGGKALSPTGGHGDGRGPGDYSDDHHQGTGLSIVCDGVTEVRRAARHMIRTGASHIKIMASGGVASPTDRIDSLQFSAEEILAIVEEAEDANIYVLAHAYGAPAINRVLELGVRSIEHGNLLDDRSIELFHEYDAILVPTLITYYALKEQGLELGLPQDSYDKVDAVLENGKEAIRMAHAGRVTMAFGTDLLGEMQLRQLEEFKLLDELMPKLDALQTATLNAAKLLRMEEEIGQLIVGGYADIIVYDQNPLDDFDILLQSEAHLKLIMKAGKIYKNAINN